MPHRKKAAGLVTGKPKQHTDQECAEPSLARTTAQDRPYADESFQRGATKPLSPQAERRLYRLAERIHALGPRPLFELFVELIAAHPEFAERLAAYAAIDGDFVRAVGGDWLFELELVPGEIGGDA